MTDHCEVIAAFVDNEPVQADDLASALASSEGREYLIDLLVLRGLVGDAQAARRAPYVAGGLQPAGQARSDGQMKHRALRLTAAAALVAISVGAGFFAARMTREGLPTDAVATTEVVQPAGSARPAPAPTHVIRMEKGVDWNERSGGN